jgi:hypothetical protein
MGGAGGLGGTRDGVGSRDLEAPEPGVGGKHRSVYERAFGPTLGDLGLDHKHALGDLGLDHTRAPWSQAGDLLDEHEHEELLYRRQMALAAQDRARSVPPPVCAWTWRASRRARRTGTLCHGTAFLQGLREPVAPVLTAGRHAQVRVVHGANGRRQQAVPPHALGLRDAPDGRVRLPEPVLASAPAFPARPGPRASERACVCGSRR